MLFMDSQNLFEYIEKIENVCKDRFNEKYQETNGTVRIDYYHKLDDELDPKFISNEEILKDRSRMLDILQNFYVNNIDDLEDFVTLFAVYCNNYIRYNLHQVLPEKDFGLSELFELIKSKDSNMKDYLDLIKNGIYKQNISSFLKAKDIKTDYSLPYLYLFIDSIKRYCSSKKNEKDIEKEKKEVEFLNRYLEAVDIETTSNIKTYYKNKTERYNLDSLELSDYSSDASIDMLTYYEKLNDDLKDYVLGKSKFLKNSKNMAKDENPLPYLMILNDESEFQDSFIKSFAQNYKVSFENSDDKEANYNSLKSSITKVLKEINNIDFKDSEVKQELLKSDLIEERLLYIGIPSVVFQFNFFSLLLKQSKLYNVNKEIQASKDKIVKEFSHKYKNMKATTLSEVAQILLENESEEYRYLGNQILLECVNKQSLTRDVYIMKMEYENDHQGLRDTLKSSLVDFQDESKIGIKYVIDKALIFCFINIFYDEDYDRVARKNLRTVWKKFAKYSDDFKDNVISKGGDCVNWLSSNGISCELNISGDWNLVSLKRENYAFIYLKDIFQELFLNYFRHGNLEKQIRFDLHSENNRLIIYMENYFKSEQTKEKTTKLGLKSLASTLPMLYEDKISIDECIRTKLQDDMFILEIEMPRNIFILEEKKGE